MLEKPAVCVLPRGSEEGHELRLEERAFVLRTGEPVRFHLVASTASRAGHVEPRAGDIVDLDAFETQPLPPIATVVRATDESARRDIPVQLATVLPEVGTLEMKCIAVDDATRRWKLEFQLRGEVSMPSRPAGASARLPEAVDAIERVFGARRKDI